MTITLLTRCNPRERGEFKIEPADSVRVSGTVLYRERVAMPPAAVVYVELINPVEIENTAEPLAWQKVTSPGNVPVPFAFALPVTDVDTTQTYALRARITDGADVTQWTTTAPVPVHWNDTTDHPVVVLRQVPGRARPTSRTYDCSGIRFTVRRQGERVRLYLGDRMLTLEPTDSADRYRAPGENVALTLRSDSARLQLSDRHIGPCLPDPQLTPWADARIRGVAFRAVGQEPGWTMEIKEDSLLFVGDYGATHYTLAIDERRANRDAARVTYRASGGEHELLAVLTGRPCRDNMTGVSYGTTVTVRIDGREFKGCGREL
ncbi:MAG: YbaY family lipoprotein [Catalinimonas sp.]